MKGALAPLAAAVGLLAFAGSVWDDGRARAALEENVLLAPGDRVRVAGTPLGCRVTRLPRHGKQLFLDCRRAGRLAGTYGTYFGKNEVLVVRFLDSRRAKIVFRAEHREEAKTCDEARG